MQCSAVNFYVKFEKKNQCNGRKKLSLINFFSLTNIILGYIWEIEMIV